MSARNEGAVAQNTKSLSRVNITHEYKRSLLSRAYTHPMRVCNSIKR